MISINQPKQHSILSALGLILAMQSPGCAATSKLSVGEKVRKANMEFIVSGEALEQSKLANRMIGEERSCIKRVLKIPENDVNGTRSSIRDCMSVAEAEAAETAWVSQTSEAIQALKLAEQYQSRLLTLKHYDYLNESGDVEYADEPIPSFERFMRSFTSEQLEAAMKFIGDPILLLVPQTSFYSKVQILDWHRLEDQKTSFYNHRVDTTGSPRIAGWQAVIINGERDVTPTKDDNLDGTFASQVEARYAFNRRHGLSGTDRDIYMMLMMEALRKGEPIDQQTSTLLDGDKGMLGLGYDIPYATWYPIPQYLRFSWLSPSGLSPGVRFRSTVKGNIL